MMTSQKDSIERIIMCLCERILELEPRNNGGYLRVGPGLACGLSGEALFLAEAYDYFKTDWIKDGLNSLIDSIYEIEIDPSDVSFFNGLAGIGYTLNYLSCLTGFQIEKRALSDINEFIMEALDNALYPEYELTLGIVGAGVYGASIDCSEGNKILNLAVRKLEEKAVKVSSGYTWGTGTDSAFSTCRETEEYNLGLAHGVPSAAALLNLGINRGCSTSISRKILKGTTTWLLEQEFDSSNSSLFPYISGGRISTRLGWCYGDLSLGSVLYDSSVTLGSRESKANALRLLERTCKRDLSLCQMNDTSICHGLMGAALQYRLLFSKTRSAGFKVESDRYLSIVLSRSEYPDEVLSTFHYFDPIRGKHVEDLSFLNGYSGVGLALLYMIDSRKSKWLEILMLNS